MHGPPGTRALRPHPPAAPYAAAVTDWAARVLDEVDAGAGAAVTRLGELVRVPSVGGADAEPEIQAMLAAEFLISGDLKTEILNV
jgi:hypothetical protein